VNTRRPLPGDVVRLLGWIDLGLGLDAEDGSVAIEHDCDDLAPDGRRTLHPDDGHDVGGSNRPGDLRQSGVEGAGRVVGDRARLAPVAG
jgi:hypothetical protein